MTTKERLREIDIAVEIHRRWNTGKEYDCFLEAGCGRKESEDSRVLYPNQKIITTPRNRSTSLSFHSIEKVAAWNYRHKVIFERNSK
ncbi:MAG: hypothetical protein ACHQYP_12885 [Nitrospiria bacterium]